MKKIILLLSMALTTTGCLGTNSDELDASTPNQDQSNTDTNDEDCNYTTTTNADGTETTTTECKDDTSDDYDPNYNQDDGTDPYDSGIDHSGAVDKFNSEVEINAHTGNLSSEQAWYIDGISEVFARYEKNGIQYYGFIVEWQNERHENKVFITASDNTWVDYIILGDGNLATMNSPDYSTSDMVAKNYFDALLNTSVHVVEPANDYIVTGATLTGQALYSVADNLPLMYGNAMAIIDNN